MKGKEIIANMSSLEQLKMKKLPPRLSMAISVNLKELEKWNDQLEEQRINLLEQYSEKDEAGNPVMDVRDGRKVYRVSEEETRRFAGEYNDLLETDIPEVKIMTVAGDILDRLEDPRYDVLTVAQIAAMEFMLV